LAALKRDEGFEFFMDDRPLTLSFAALDARIEAVPEGPASILRTPRILFWLNILC